MRKARLLVVLCAFVHAVSSAQTTSAVIVQGLVIDGLTSLPVAGARVIVARSERTEGSLTERAFATQPSAGEPDPRADYVAVLTGNDGGFRLALDGLTSFYLFADAPGYARPFSGLGRENFYEVQAGGRLPDILVRMTPALSISGRVIDRDTGQGVSGLTVRIHGYRPAGPGRVLVPAGVSSTGAEGRFTIYRLAPGDYYLDARTPLGQQIGEPKPSRDFPNDILMGYLPWWYPGVERFEEALPVKLFAGGEAQEFEIKIRKSRIASLRGRLRGAGDSERGEGGEAELTLMSVGHGATSASQAILARGAVKIGSEFQIDGIPPGSYWLTARGLARSLAERQSAVLAIEVADKNLEGLDLFLAKRLRVSGQVRIEGRNDPNQPALPVEHARLLLRPLVRLFPDSQALEAPVRSSDGSFTIEDVFPDKFFARVAGAPAGHEIAEVRYNGARAAHGVVQFGSAMEHKLEIVLAPADAGLSVEVADGARAAARATVLVVREPIAEDFLLYSAMVLRQAKTDQHGKAAIAGLVPGRYRLAAYPEEFLWGDDDQLRQRLAAGEAVMVEAMRTATAKVRIAVRK